MKDPPASSLPPPGMEAVATVILRALEQFRVTGEPRGAVVSGESCGRTQLGVHLARVVTQTTRWLYGAPSLSELRRARGLVLWDDANLTDRRIAACFKGQVDRGRAFWVVFCRDQAVPRLRLRLAANFDEKARCRALKNLFSLYRIDEWIPEVVGLSRGFDLKQCEQMTRAAVDDSTDHEITIEDFVRASRKMRHLDEFDAFPDLDSLGGDLVDVLARLESALVAPLASGRRPRNAVVYGPTGSGKTAALRYVARQAIRNSVSVIQVHCAELLKPKLGETEKSIAAVFDDAKRRSPCLLVFDNIDLIGAPRGHDTTTEGSMDRAVGTLLMLIDGFNSSSKIAPDDAAAVGILAATGALHRLDEALLRPGRLGEVRCALTLPERTEQRLDILAKIAQKISIDDSESTLKKLAEITDGFSGAELRAVLRDAVALALRDQEEEEEDGETPLLVRPNHVETAHANLARAMSASRFA